MIGFIKNLFSGILSFFIGLVGGKKSEENKPSIKAANAKQKKRSGYFMELDEAEETKSVNGNQQALVGAAKKTEPVAAAKQAKAEPAKTPAPVAAAKAPKVELVQTAEGLRAEPAKSASSSPVANGKAQQQTETTFAPKYLNPASSSNGRRRPGPSMNPFLDMARQVKTPG